MLQALFKCSLPFSTVKPSGDAPDIPDGCSRSLLRTSRTHFGILLRCNGQLNFHLQLDKSFSSHSAQTLVKLACLLLWAPEWNYLQWASSAEKHPCIDLLPGQLWAMPLFQSEIWRSLELSQEFTGNFVKCVVFELLANGDQRVWTQEKKKAK